MDDNHIAKNSAAAGCKERHRKLGTRIHVGGGIARIPVLEDLAFGRALLL